MDKIAVLTSGGLDSTPLDIRIAGHLALIEKSMLSCLGLNNSIGGSCSSRWWPHDIGVLASLIRHLQVSMLKHWI